MTIQTGTSVLWAAAFTVALLSLQGCSMNRFAVRQTAVVLEKGVETFYDEPDVELAEDALASQLKLVEALLRSAPDDRRLNLLAAQGFGAYAFLFMEGVRDDRARGFYRRGRDYGLRALGHRKPFRDLRSMDLQKTETALASARKSDVPALFWTAYCWAGWINLSLDNMEAVAELPKAVAMLERSLSLDPGYHFAGAHLVLGAYFATRPKMLGGDPNKARENFSRAQELTGGKYLLAFYLEARYYAMAILDEKLFRELLDMVRTGTAGALPGARLADEVAKRKAKDLLEIADDHF